MKTNTCFFIITRSFLLRMRNISDKSCRENQNTHFVCSNSFFENCADYEKMWKNTVERFWPQMTMWRMRIACWIPQAINTHSDSVIFIAFPQQHWLHERTSKLRCTYIARIVTELDLAGYDFLFQFSVQTMIQTVAKTD